MKTFRYDHRMDVPPFPAWNVFGPPVLRRIAERVGDEQRVAHLAEICAVRYVMELAETAAEPDFDPQPLPDAELEAAEGIDAEHIARLIADLVVDKALALWAMIDADRAFQNADPDVRAARERGDVEEADRLARKRAMSEEELMDLCEKIRAGQEASGGDGS
jgi:hypothetical protein